MNDGFHSTCVRFRLSCFSLPRLMYQRGQWLSRLDSYKFTCVSVSFWLHLFDKISSHFFSVVNLLPADLTADISQAIFPLWTHTGSYSCWNLLSSTSCMLAEVVSASGRQFSTILAFLVGGRYYQRPQWKAETCLVNKLIQGEPAP